MRPREVHAYAVAVQYPQTIWRSSPQAPLRWATSNLSEWNSSRSGPNSRRDLAARAEDDPGCCRFQTHHPSKLVGDGSVRFGWLEDRKGQWRTTAADVCNASDGVSDAAGPKSLAGNADSIARDYHSSDAKGCSDDATS